ncbi:hypothetical protein [Nostoc sp. WHI]|uniref:hypothetical protein n=1 Tax=Nostoc sp. WHI TaxID=2650611 RepID=UPI0018C4EDE5|nr:hypothetical protein [Nostoc sp. WHI]MBG1268322.1 hypothetical protein [Nostoc sp. WHI]MBG1268569.1 hypothetical protein [Nostoc sp. WHI]
MELGCFQKDVLIEKLAKKFYAILGYVVRDDYKMQNATHPAERACVAMALFAIQEFESIEDECSDEEVEDESETDSTKKVITWFRDFWKFSDREQIKGRVQDYIISLNYLTETESDKLGKWTWEDFSSFKKITKKYPMPEVAEAQVDWKKVGTFIHELFGVSFYEDEELEEDED